MSSRLRPRSLVTRLFECYIRFERPPQHAATNGHPPSGPSAPAVAFIHPPSFSDPELVKAAAKFAFPLPPEDEHGEETSVAAATPVLFTFVLTSGSSEWTFGYVRSSRGPTHSVALFLTFLPHQELFFKALNRIAELGPAFLEDFTALPEPGTCFSAGKDFVVPIEDERRLPEIPANRHLSEFFAALSPSSMLALFQSLLAERRIVVVSRRLGRLSSLCVAASLFLFPMHWQHIFIPCLPCHLVDYLSAPMPFIIGVHSSVWNTAEAGNCVVVDADADAVIAFEEDRFPPPVEAVLLEGFGSGGLGEGLARGFLRGLAMLMGHWQDAVVEGRFDEDIFCRLAHPAYRPYLRSKLLRLQIFRQFIEERVERLRNGGIESDEFELEAIAWRRSGGARLAVFGGGSHQNKAIRRAGQRVFSSVKRESNHLLESVKHNSALKSALRSVKEGGKTVKQRSHGALSDIKSKFHVPLAFSPNSGGGGSGASYVAGVGRPLPDEPRVHLAPLPATLPAPVLASSASVNTLAGSDDVARRKTAPQPRLSRSEENLIDLDGGNPLYELLNGQRADSGSVFEDWDFGGEAEEAPPAPVLPPPRRAHRDRDSSVRPSQNHSQSLGELLELEGAPLSGGRGPKGVGAEDLSLLAEYGLGTYFSSMNLNTTTVPAASGAGTPKGGWTTFE